MEKSASHIDGHQVFFFTVGSSWAAFIAVSLLKGLWCKRHCERRGGSFIPSCWKFRCLFQKKI